MDLNTFWFIVIAAMFCGFFFLEGFDYGVGIVLPFLAKRDAERRVVISSIGPFWDGNEVWLITAGAVMFAAFPGWYATLFSGFYLLMLALLVALIVRGVGFEFRNRDDNPMWRKFWDWMIFTGSFVPALIWGIIITDLVRGLAINANYNYAGSTLDLLNPYALLGGLAFVALFTLHGLIFLSLKTEDLVRYRAESLAGRLWLPVVGVVVAWLLMLFVASDIFSRLSLFSGLTLAGAATALLASGWFIRAKHSGRAFVMSGLTIILATITLFAGLFPRLMISTLNPDWSLTIYNAAASPYSLEIMSWIATGLVPLVIAYQAWNYWVFRQRVSQHSTHHL